jgi:hypothetical protein
MENQDPQPLGATIASLVRDYPPEHRLHQIAADIAGEADACRSRRAAVLKHKDLRARLVAELGYARPEQWNGYIPPATISRWSDDELSRSPEGRPNQRGKRAAGEQANDSPRRAVLMEISAEAWNREHPS